jgi:hypothetical protein
LLTENLPKSQVIEDNQNVESKIDLEIKDSPSKD